jgi:hypothetical protein
MAFPVARTGLLQVGVPYRDPHVSLGTTGAGWSVLFFTSASNFVTPANVYQDAALATAFSPTGQVTADANGLFPPIYLDTSVNYGVQFVNAAMVVQRQYVQHQGSLASTGNDASTGAGQGLNLSAFNEYNLRTVAGGSGAALTVKAQAPAGIPLRLTATSPGAPALAINNTVTTGAQTATFTATNKPGAGQVTVLLTVAPPPGAGYVGGTLTANWPYATMSATATVTLSTGQVISGATLTNGSTTFTTPSTTITGVPNTAISVSTGIGPVAWLSFSCDGSIYYTPLWRLDDFLPFGTALIPAQVNGQTISAATVTFNGNGSSSVTGTGATVVPSSWYTPNQTNIGSGYWITITKTGGLAGLTFSAAANTNITNGGLTITSNGAAQITGTYNLSSSVTGSPIVASGTITLAGGNGVQQTSYSGPANLVLGGDGTATIGGGGAAPNWFLPTTGNTGSGYWINITRTGGSTGTNFSVAQGSWVNITNGGLTIGLTGGGTNASGTYQIATNSSGTQLVANGTIALTQSFTPVTNTYNSAGTFTETIPNGATTVVIEDSGSSGNGGNGANGNSPPHNDWGGGGGASGSYCRTSFSVGSQNGKSFTVVVAAASSGASSTVTQNTVTGFAKMTSPGGVAGSNATSTGAGNAGAGAAAPAIATGGTAQNTAGNAGTAGGPGNGGTGGSAIVGVNETGPKGGNGGDGSGNVGHTNGGAGKIVFKYT